MNTRLLAALFALAGAAATARAQEPIRIGEFASMTGANASFGRQSHQGTQLAIDEINARGGVLGRRLQLITEDDQSAAGQAATAVQKLIAQDKVVALLGEVASSKSLEAAPIAQRNKIPMISPASTNPKVTETGDYIFRVCFIDPFQGTVMAKYALSKGWKKVALLTDVKQDYSVGLAEYFLKYFTAHGGTIVRDQKFSSGDKEFRAQLTSIKAASPDAVFVPGYYAEVALIGKQARLLGLNQPFLGGDGWMGDSLLPVAAGALDGSAFSAHFSPDDTRPAVQDFVRRYRARFNSAPDDMAALGYDSAMILADAIRRAGGTDAAKLRDAIAATKNHEGITGSITLDGQRNANKAATILTITKDGFKFQETVAP